MICYCLVMLNGCAKTDVRDVEKREDGKESISLEKRLCSRNVRKKFLNLRGFPQNIYMGYIFPGVMDKEQRYAYQGDMSSRDLVTVYRVSEENGEAFMDNYPDILVKPVYQKSCKTT